KPLRARDPRAFLTATRHVGVYSVRPGRKHGSAGPDKRMEPKRRKLLFEVPWSPIHVNEEACQSRALGEVRQNRVPGPRVHLEIIAIPVLGGLHHVYQRAA